MRTATAGISSGSPRALALGVTKLKWLSPRSLSETRVSSLRAELDLGHRELALCGWALRDASRALEDEPTRAVEARAVSPLSQARCGWVRRQVGTVQ